MYTYIDFAIKNLYNSFQESRHMKDETYLKTRISARKLRDNLIKKFLKKCDKKSYDSTLP